MQAAAARTRARHSTAGHQHYRRRQATPCRRLGARRTMAAARTQAQARDPRHIPSPRPSTSGAVGGELLAWPLDCQARHHILFGTHPYALARYVLQWAGRVDGCFISMVASLVCDVYGVCIRHGHLIAAIGTVYIDILPTSIGWATNIWAARSVVSLHNTLTMHVCMAIPTVDTIADGFH